MELQTLKMQYFRQQIDRGIKNIISAQQSIARERSAGSEGGRGKALADALTNVRHSIADSGQGVAAEVWVPLQLRFVDMKKYGNWRIYNRQVWGTLYRDTLQEVKYEFRDWVRKHFPEMLKQVE